MNNHKNKLTGSAFAVFALCGFAQQASAELYISPVVRQTVKIDNTSPNQNSGSIAVQEQSRSITGESSVHGEFLMREEAEAPLESTMRFGKNVPLFIALEKVVPDSKNWFIHFDDGLENLAVSWKGGRTWEDVISIIEKENNINIKINHEEHAIGISKDAQLSIYLAKKLPAVWKVSPKMTLRENLDAWSKRAGWNLVWDENLKIDYPIVHGAVLTGDFIGEGGVVDTLLYSMRFAEKPLTAKFHTKNKVLFVTEAGYRQEVAN